MEPKIVPNFAVVLDLSELHCDTDEYVEFGLSVYAATLAGGAPVIAAYAPHDAPWLLHLTVIDETDAKKLLNMAQELFKEVREDYENGGWLND